MRVLWIVNIVFPKVCAKLGLPQPVSGGWLYARAEQLTRDEGVELAVATVYKGRSSHVLEQDGIRYYLLPVRKLDKYQTKLESEWKTICADYKPDLVHINGTEYPHGLACMNALPEQRYAVSLQGLVSVISRYYYGGLTFADIARNTSFPELVLGRSIWSAKRTMTKRGRFENEYISRADAISGRTTWDYSHTRAINPVVPYYHSPRSLRSVFYESATWNSARMKHHTIFISKGTSPFKGMHQVLKAASLLVARYPDLQIRVAGKDMLSNKGWKSKVRKTAYQRFLSALVNHLGLRSHIHFTGKLDAAGIAAELLGANVFVCPSAIENSSNSIAEAQILGVPVVASDVGGNMDMVEHGVNGYIYRFEEHELLAHYIAQVFEENDLAKNLSQNAIEVARLRHDPQACRKSDMQMYNDLIATSASRSRQRGNID